MCEATALIDLVVVALFAWVHFAGISRPNSAFDVSVAALSVALVSIAVAAISYFFVPEKYRANSALVAYILMLTAVGILSVQTGQVNSPFLALWMIGTIFSSIFGLQFISFLFGGYLAYLAYLFATQQLSENSILGLLLAGLLPLVMSFILWHGKSSNEKTKERAYYDLANELNEVSNKSEAVINAINDGVIAINDKGLIELINPAAERLVGWSQKDALHLDYKSVLHLTDKTGHDLDKATDPILEVLTTNQPKRRNDLQLQSNTGKKFVVDLVISGIGRLGSGVIIVFRDITKEQAEERAQAEFISTASHEMRTPVASIEGYLGLALNPATATIDAKARDFITKAHAAAQHLGRLFQDLLDVTKADDGRLSNNPTVIDMIQFTQDIIEGLKPKADEKNLRLFFKAGDEKVLNPIYYVHLDSDHLREVLANLVENAIKYTPAGEVIINVDGDEEHVEVSIQDSGIGIPKEDIAHLFQKFYRVDNSDTREIGGTGLGLYLCRRLVEAMNGRIWVESEYKKGSTFFVELPRITHEEAQRLIESKEDAVINPIPVGHAAGSMATIPPQEDGEPPKIGPVISSVPSQSVPTVTEATAAAQPPTTVTPVAAIAQPVQITNKPEPVKPAEPQQPTAAVVTPSSAPVGTIFNPAPPPTTLTPAPQFAQPAQVPATSDTSMTQNSSVPKIEPLQPQPATTPPVQPSTPEISEPAQLLNVKLPEGWAEKIAKAKAANNIVEQPIELPPAPVAQVQQQNPILTK